MSRRGNYILSVAEKPSVARELANILSNNQPYNTKNGYSPYNKIFEIPNVSFMNQPNYFMKMTSVTGHVLEIEFDPRYKGWNDCLPIDLFTAPIQRKIKPENVRIQQTLEEESRNCSILLLWLDCDLEGESIGFEVIEICKKSNPNLTVYRARFSALIPRDIFRAMAAPEQPNQHFNAAVLARQEIDLRLGAAFTRFQTLRLQKKFELGPNVISYGPCQFPTLGFVVERYIQIQKFIPESYWSISCDFKWTEETGLVDANTMTNNNNSRLTTSFKWDRGCVYDQYTALILYENCLDFTTEVQFDNIITSNNTETTTRTYDMPNENRDPNTQRPHQQQQNQLVNIAALERPSTVTVLAKVIKCDNRPTSRIRPCPLNTIELQKRASRFLNMGSDRTMTIAESLYQRGILSYPRTETDFFKEGTELLPLLQEQRNHNSWGEYASSLLNIDGSSFNYQKFEWPKNGGHDDQAHPPIHPLKSVDLNELDRDEKAIYELVTRHFLACCSKDGRGNLTTVTIQIPASPSSSLVGPEVFSASGLMITERNWLDIYGRFEKWSASKVPNFKVGDTFQPSSIMLNESKTNAPLPISESDLISDMDKNGIGTDATIATHIKTIQERDYVTKLEDGNRFVPTKLGLALIEGYNEMGYQLNKPFLRASMEKDCQRIAKGELTKDTVVMNVLEQMKKCYETCFQEASKLDRAIAKHFSKVGMNEEVNSYTIVKNNFITCGKCQNKMCLRMKSTDVNNGNAAERGEGRRGNNVRGGRGRRGGRGNHRGRGGRANYNQQLDDDDDDDEEDNDEGDDIEDLAIPDNTSRHLYCSECSEVYILPPKGILTAHTVVCPICQFQVLNVRNAATNKEHTLCPHCFSTPPGAPFSDGVLSDFRCLSCSHTTCSLAGKRPGENISIVSCPEQNCSFAMKLKRTKTDKYMLTCASSQEGNAQNRGIGGGGYCGKVWWFPKAIKLAVPLENEICEKCRQSSSGQLIVTKVKISVILSQAPLGTPPEATVCVCCDSLWDNFGITPFPRRKYGRQPHQPPQHQMQPQHTNNPPVTFVSNHHNQQSINARSNITSNTSHYQPSHSNSYTINNIENNQNSTINNMPQNGNVTNCDCDCRIPGSLFTVHKDGPNKGRSFYKCGSKPQVCDFFKWV